MNCVILQPSYIPWRGYFHQILKADTFIFYDDVKYDKNGWRNRNRIKTPQGLKWLTIPVYSKGVETNHTPINQIEISWDRDWIASHWSTIRMAYHRAPFFEIVAEKIEPLFHQHPILLADFTIDLTEKITSLLGIEHVKFLRSSGFDNLQGEKTDRLIQILERVGADHYISGPSARDYIDAELFRKAGISLEYMKYDYPEYQQLYPPYDPQVTIMDLMFMVGTDAINYIEEKNN